MSARRSIARLANDRRGASAVEFALTLPIVATLLTGVVTLGNFLSVRNSLNSAIDETSRYATLYPTPTDQQLRTRFNNRLTRKLNANKVTFTPTRGAASATVNFINITASYPVKIDVVFVNAGTVNATAKRKVYVGTTP